MDTPSPQPPAAASEPRPTLLFDGDCGFCRRWIERWIYRAGDRVEFVPFQEAAGRYPGLAPSDLAAAVHLVEPGGRTASGAGAVFGALSRGPGGSLGAWCYRSFRGFARGAEWLYRWVARRRDGLGVLARLLWGPAGPATVHITRNVFLRGLGAIYFIAFVSLWSQIDGLIGSNGILPIAPYLDYVRPRSGLERFWQLPTLCWWAAGDGALNLQCAAGALLAVLGMLGLLPGFGFLALWVLYLSLTVAGQIFLGYQWDNLLLEVGLLAALWAPWTWRARLARDPEPSRLVHLLLKLLLFKLMFSSGVVKLASGDETWKNLTALTYHYETQPLTTWTAWYLHQLPLAIHKVSCAGMFAIELACPFFIFAPRRLRLFLAAVPMVLLQVMIMATGNYTFFNLLSILLCVPLLDDRCWPARWRGRLGYARAHAPSPALRAMRRLLTWPVAAGILAITTVQLAGLARRPIVWPRPVVAIYRAAAPLRSVNSYGLFAVMTKSRPEIIVEGSYDGKQWVAYEFKWKPGDPRRRPEFVAPHQPRLDWQMWFAALGQFEHNAWFRAFAARLLQGSPEVLGLLRHNPFWQRPPTYLRAVVYDYHFTDRATRRDEGTWWWYDNGRRYAPELSLRTE
jgi:predicted DCC family thiol-disulfide oxidoreductase YuxK